MNRAEWRRVKFLKVDIGEKGCRYIGPLGFLGVICDYLRTHDRVMDTYGVKKPKADMPRWTPPESIWQP